MVNYSKIIYSLVFLLTLLLTSCENNTDKYEVRNYIKEESIMDNLEPLLPYLSKLEMGVNYENRFDTINKAYFIERQKIHKFSFERYFITEDSIHYFLIWKVAPSLYEKKIAIGGRYKKDSMGRIYAFEEIFNTPKMKLDELKEKSFMLFDSMVEKGNVDQYLGDFLLIEFPDGMCMYDKENAKWILTNNKRWEYKPFVK